MLLLKGGRAHAALVHCPTVQHLVHVYRSEAECREEHGCSSCALAGRFHSDGSGGFAQHTARSQEKPESGAFSAVIGQSLNQRIYWPNQQGEANRHSHCSDGIPGNGLR